MGHEITPARIEALVYRAPIASPLHTSFGTMRDRPCVIVRVTDRDGSIGWGEAWCNWPTVAAEYRARLVGEVVAPAMLEKTFESPQAAFEETSRRMEKLTLQTGDVGPLAQAVSGIDLALWDLAARKAGKRLCDLIGDANRADVPAYASGLNPDRPEMMARRRHDEGHRAFKLKIGFGRERDLRNLAALRDELGDGVAIAVDANMAFELDEAIAMSEAMAPFDLLWFEEPLRADASNTEWKELAARSPVRLAAGENLRGHDLHAAIDSGTLGVIQPDVSKWGGISGNLPVIRAANRAGMVFCPHWLAGGIGLRASMHLLAAFGGDGLLEYDSNPNPLRERLADDFLEIADGRIAIPDAPGIGIAPDLEGIDDLAVEKWG
ncbi:MAG: mandelate racemase/muconate lactonizing enzyme family protein [Geminicoccaceae bacterium]|nr:mandelate racemase/muconate lactonizing enzyme family protein [Geminicoccaceae bacterium]